MRIFGFLLLATVVLAGVQFARHLSATQGEPAADVADMSGQLLQPGTAAATTAIKRRNEPANGIPTTEPILDQAVAERVSEVLQATEENQQQNAGESSNAADHPVSQPIRHQARLHDQMITPGNFEYLGAFRPPHVELNGVTFGYGGWGIAYREDGDPEGALDGFPGSLYLVGHQQHQQVAELSIPRPFVSRRRNADELPVAQVLQPFADITGGLQSSLTDGSSEPFQIGGMLVTDNKLHWTLHKYYNVEGVDLPSHGTTDLELGSLEADGPWHLGPLHSGLPQWHSYKHAGYILEVPQQEADTWFGGRNLISGLQISTGLQYSSQGPALFAYRLPPAGTLPGRSLDALPLCWYSEESPLPGHHPADRWTGAAWLTLGDKQAVIVVGRKSHGALYYGEPRPGDCSPYKGYHGPPYDVEVAFYSPASLIHVAHGQLPAKGLSPWLRWDGRFDGGSISQYLFPTCGQDVGGLAYDRARNLIYLTQTDAAVTKDNQWESLPVIHVFRIVQ
jgi:hypothetical protein